MSGGSPVPEKTEYTDKETGTSEDKFLGQKERRRSSALKMFLGDYLNLASNAPASKLMQKNGDKKVVFSDVVIKVNKRNKMQERILLVTESGIYNIDPSNYKQKRRIALKDLGSVSLSKLPDNFFALHVPSEYDYLVVSSKKTEIVTKLQEAFKELTDKTLAVNFGNSFDYRIDADTVREIHFSRVEGGVSTQIYTKQKPKGK